MLENLVDVLIKKVREEVINDPDSLVTWAKKSMDLAK